MNRTDENTPSETSGDGGLSADDLLMALLQGMFEGIAEGMGIELGHCSACGRRMPPEALAEDPQGRCIVCVETQIEQATESN